jgi:Dolichyl-phosphate-mannose-protein mannosyltransferase
MRLLSRSLWFWVWLGLGIYLALTLWLGFVGLVYPYQLDYGEGIVLWFARELAHGQSIYTLPGAPLFASSNYPPVSMLLSAALMPLFGDGYTSGRLLNFAAALIVAALIYRIVKTEAKNARAGALAALFFIGSPYIYHWVPLFRADLIGLGFAFAGIYFVWEWQRVEEGRRQKAEGRDRDWFSAYWLLATAYLFFLLALYTKQSLFAAPAAACLALFARNRRTAIAFAVALGAIGGAIYLALDAATSGGFTFGLITSNATVFLTGQLVPLLENFVTTFPILLLLALWAWVNRIRARQVGVLEWYALISFATLTLAGRVGAWENYFFEAIAAACVFAGIAVGSWQSAVGSWQLAVGSWQSPGNRPQTSVLRSPSLRQTQGKLLVLPLLLLVQLALMWHDPRIAANLVAQDLPANQQLATLLARTRGTVISEDMGALVTSGKPVAYYTFQYSSLARSGEWDQHWELNGLRDHAFPLVILERGTREDVDHYRRFTRDFVSALDRYYAVTQTIGKYEIYTPAPPLTWQRADFDGAIALVGWSASPNALQPGALHVSMVWRAERAMTQRYTAFVHLEKMNGDKVTQDDHEPHGGDYPTTRWAPNEMVREAYTLNVPNGLAPGKYALLAGWYDTETGDRLSVPGSTDNTVTLTTYEVK